MTANRVQPPTSAPVGTSLVAYRLHPGVTMPLVPAPAKRAWMDATRERFAYRCLPLLIANQAGWVLLSEHTVLATWDGGAGKEAVRVEYLRGDPPYPATSHFGHGVLTWAIPYVFRTSAGYNVLLRGPANHPKDGASPLEGIVETDWTAATATMNWKLTRPGLTVRFDVGEPVAMVVPARRGELEEVVPECAELSDDRELATRHAAWSQSRRRFLGDLRGRREPGSGLWQKDYFHGRDPDGERNPGHQRKLVVAPVADRHETTQGEPAVSPPERGGQPVESDIQ